MTIQKKLTPSARFAYYQAHSAPVMEEEKSWGETHLANKGVKKSAPGKAKRYFIKLSAL